MGKKGNEFAIQMVATILVLFVTSLFFEFIPGAGAWTPIFSDWLNVDYIYSNKFLMILAGSLSLVGLLVSVFAVTAKIKSSLFDVRYVLLFTLLLIFLFNGGVYFSVANIVAILLVWIQYFVIKKSLFLATFLLGTASLFFSPLIWTFPIVLLIIILKTTEKFRETVILTTGFLLPFLYIISFRLLKYNDTSLFLERFFEDAVSLSFNIVPTGFSTLTSIVITAFIVIHAAINPLSKMFQRKGYLSDYIMGTELMTLFLVLLLVVLYGGNSHSNMFIMLIPSMSFLLSDYFRKNGDNNITKRELYLLLVVAIIDKINYFI